MVRARDMVLLVDVLKSQEPVFVQWTQKFLVILVLGVIEVKNTPGGWRGWLVVA